MRHIWEKNCVFDDSQNVAFFLLVSIIKDTIYDILFISKSRIQCKSSVRKVQNRRPAHTNFTAMFFTSGECGGI